MPKVLFLCTGNYYRSRFAEELFNHHAQRDGLPWKADSAGLRVEESRSINPGTFSKHSYAALAERSVSPTDDKREPRQVTAKELEESELVIALCDREHRPMILELFPDQLSHIRFWTVEDIGFEQPATATEQIESQVLDLARSLKKAEG